MVINNLIYYYDVNDDYFDNMNFKKCLQTRIICGKRLLFKLVRIEEVYDEKRINDVIDRIILNKLLLESEYNL